MRTLRGMHSYCCQVAPPQTCSKLALLPSTSSRHAHPPRDALVLLPGGSTSDVLEAGSAAVHLQSACAPSEGCTRIAARWLHLRRARSWLCCRPPPVVMRTLRGMHSYCCQVAPPQTCSNL